MNFTQPQHTYASQVLQTPYFQELAIPHQAFTITQAHPEAVLIFDPPMGSVELETLVGQYTPGYQPIMQKIAQLSTGFLENFASVARDFPDMTLIYPLTLDYQVDIPAAAYQPYQLPSTAAPFAFQQPFVTAPQQLPVALSPCKHATTPAQPAPPAGQAAKPKGRQTWTEAETNALINGVTQLGPQWAAILSIHGQNGTVSNALANRNQVALKDKARNIKLLFLKQGQQVPPGFEHVTGELMTRAPTHAANMGI